MDTHKPWYQSPAVQGIIVILVSRLLARCNLSAIIPAGIGVDLVNAGLEALTGAGALWIARELKNPPTTITLTKAAADVANASYVTKEGTSNAQPIQISVPPAPAPAGSVSSDSAPKP